MMMMLRSPIIFLLSIFKMKNFSTLLNLLQAMLLSGRASLVSISNRMRNDVWSEVSTFFFVIRESEGSVVEKFSFLFFLPELFFFSG